MPTANYFEQTISGAGVREGYKQPRNLQPAGGLQGGGERIDAKECVNPEQHKLHSCIKSPLLKVFEDSQETFFKKFLEQGLGQRPKVFSAFVLLFLISAFYFGFLKDRVPGNVGKGRGDCNIFDVYFV